MNDQIPSGKLRRSLIGGKTAARVGGGVIKYMAKKPFLSQQAKLEARKNLDDSSARAIFLCLSMLKGTALKVAQLLSLELELFPDAVCKELEKSYSQVPPMNRVLARKTAINALKQRPEEVFSSFVPTAFAAASLGQVHEATSSDGLRLAVKLQYPGIRRTIEDDMQLIKGMIRPLPDFRLIAPIMKEIETRLKEEIDYRQEAKHMVFFWEKLDIPGVIVPQLWEAGSGSTVLSSTLLPGQPLNQWLETNPSDRERDVVAKRLNDIFVESLYTLNCIHADPNPGNFLVDDDLNVGLVDFGCVKSFSPEFVESYRKLPQTIMRGDRQKYFDTLRDMHFIKENLPPKVEEEIFEAAYAFGEWLGQLYKVEEFDFEKNPGFIAAGKDISQKLFKYRKHFNSNPEFVFLDRTRYGLFRIFEQLKCRVRIRNPHECDSA